MIKLTEVIGCSFYKLYYDVMKEEHTHYWLKGGRGSLKSSFIGSMIPLKIMDDASKGIHSNALAIRRVKDTLKDSVYEQIVWAINKLDVASSWSFKESPLKLTYIPTGQVILFRGMDKPKKLKSTKVSKGWIKYVWYEEVDEIEGIEKIRTVNQSLLRGGENFLVFYSFNPPESNRNWTNKEVVEQRADKVTHHTTYLTVPRVWLGEQFILEAEYLKKSNPVKYNHDYLGEVTGTGGEIFHNVTARPITEEEINVFDRVNRGLDFGFASDPTHYTENYYDSRRRKLYVFTEIHKAGMSNKSLVDAIEKVSIEATGYIIADSAEPRTINELRILGLKIMGAKKGPDSVRNGVKWLTELEEIIIDPNRCPNTYREFISYEREKDKEGNFKDQYPDRNNHSIDCIRYSLESYIRNNIIRAGNRL